jgi:hypothetical protein
MYIEYFIIISILTLIALSIVRSKRKDFKLEANRLINFLGGKNNIINYEFNQSRFIVTLNDIGRVNKEAIQKMGHKE